jgi:hypothetical protein
VSEKPIIGEGRYVVSVWLRGDFCGGYRFKTIEEAIERSTDSNEKWRCLGFVYQVVDLGEVPNDRARETD